MERAAQIRKQRETRSETRGGDDLIDRAQALLFSRDDDPVTGLVQRRDADTADQAYLPALHEVLHALTERAARRQGIPLAASEQLAEVSAADSPQQAGCQRTTAQLPQPQQ